MAAVNAVRDVFIMQKALTFMATEMKLVSNITNTERTWMTVVTVLCAPYSVRRRSRSVRGRFPTIAVSYAHHIESEERDDSHLFVVLNHR